MIPRFRSDDLLGGVERGAATLDDVGVHGMPPDRSFVAWNRQGRAHAGRAGAAERWLSMDAPPGVPSSDDASRRL